MKSDRAHPGHLYVIGTPIGNLGDLSKRAIDILSSCDCIACETPKITQKLLAAFKLSSKKLFTYRDAGEAKSAQHLLEKLQNGQSLALVSDAGTPTISDPGYHLVQLCRGQQIPIVPIPGPNAAITALSVSGFPTHTFLYLGFLSIKSSKVEKLFQSHKTFRGTVILYESPHRIRKLIPLLRKFFDPTCRICVARELTKLNESYYYGLLGTFDESTLPLKGEYVVLMDTTKS